MKTKVYMLPNGNLIEVDNNMSSYFLTVYLCDKDYLILMRSGFSYLYPDAECLGEL